MNIVVFGMHRSGTSVTTNLIRSMGANVGPESALLPPRPDNPRGFWELRQVMELNNEMLAACGSAWDRPTKFDATKLSTADKRRFENAIQDLLKNIDNPPCTVIKDPRLCLTFPIWKPFLEPVFAIHVSRDPIEVAHSLQVRDDVPLPTGLALWEWYTVSAWRATSGLPRHAIRYKDLMTSPVETVDSIYRAIVNKFDVDISPPSKSVISSIVDSSLRHQTSDPDESTLYLSEFQQHLYTCLEKNASLDDCGIQEPSPLAFHILQQYEREEDLLALTQVFHTLLDSRLDVHTGSETERMANNLHDAFSSGIERLREYAGHVDALLDATRNHTESTASRIEELSGDLLEVKTENSAMHVKIAELNKEVEHLEATLKTEKLFTLSLQQDLAASQQDLAANQQANDDLRVKIDEFSSSNAAVNNILVRTLSGQSESDTPTPPLDEPHAADTNLLQNVNALKLDFEKTKTELTATQQLVATLSELRDEQQGVIADLSRDIRSLFNSFTWRAGRTIVNLFHHLTFRSPPPTVEEHLRKTLRDAKTLIKSAEDKRPFGASSVSLRGRSPGRIRMLVRIIVLCFTNFRTAIRLLSPRRLLNLFITIFHQPRENAIHIFQHYNQLLSTSSYAHTVKVRADLDKEELKPITLPDVSGTVQVSIIVPVFNHFIDTYRCLASIAENTGDSILYEVILADDASTDETISIDKVVHNCRVIHADFNRGFLLNCNNAAKHAKGDFLVFLNNDTIAQPDWLAPLVEVANRNQDIGIVGPKFLFPDSSLQEAGGIIWSDASGWNFGRGQQADMPEYNYVREVDYISGACLLIRRDLWNLLGGFDTRYTPAYYEDTDLCFAARAKGFRTIYQPTSQIVHLEGVSHGTDTDSGTKHYQEINREKFFQKWKEILSTEHFENAHHVFTARERPTTRKVILVVDHYVPHFDRDAGSICTYHYIRFFLNSGMKVVFIGDNFFPHQPYTSVLEQMGVEVLYGNYYANHWKHWLEQNGQYIDYAYLNRPHISVKYIKPLRELTSAKLLYFGHDLHYLREQRQHKITKDKKLLESAQKWRASEYEIFRAVDTVYFPSQVEIDEIATVAPEINARQIPLYIYDHVKRPVPGYSDRNDLFFIGGFRHPPNIDGILWFVNAVLPRLHRILPDVKLTIAGSFMPDSVISLASESVDVVGAVSDEQLDILFNQARIMVVPLRFGAGIKGKVLQGLEKGIPIVTTTIGAEGLPDAGQFMVVADDEELMANEIARVYTDEDVWFSLTQTTAAYLEKYFSARHAHEILSNDIDF